MSINPEYDGTVTLRPYPNGAEPEPAAAIVANQAPPATPAEFNPPAQAIQPAYLPEPPLFEAPAPVMATARISSRPRWVVPAAIGAVGIIASGSLGYFLWSTTGQRDAARHQLASTEATLTSTQATLTTAQSDAAARKRVVAVAAAKFEGTGVEALALAIPVQTVCTMLVTCDRLPAG